MSKHILVNTQYFYPEQFRINDICQEWVKQGHKVTVITGIPNYPMGKYYKGYGLFKKRREIWNGIEIRRIPLIPRGRGPIGMVLNYFSYVISGFFWAKFTKLKTDLVFNFEVSPMTQVKVGCWFAKRRNIPNYLYVQDLWPENVQVVTGINNPLIINPIRRMVDKIYAQCDHIFTTSPSFVEDIKLRVKDKDKVSYLPQYAEDFYKPKKKEECNAPEIPDDDSFKIIFTGNIGKAQGLDILPKVAKDIDGVKFIIVGEGRYQDEFIKEIKELKVEEKFILVGKKPAELIPDYLCKCDAAFLSFADNSLWNKTIPAKLQSYMACGMPIIAHAEGETKRIINKHECGLTSQIKDIEGLIKNINIIKLSDLEGYKINSLMYYKNNFDSTRFFDNIEKELQ